MTGWQPSSHATDAARRHVGTELTQLKTITIAGNTRVPIAIDIIILISHQLQFQRLSILPCDTLHGIKWDYQASLLAQLSAVP